MNGQHHLRLVEPPRPQARRRYETRIVVSSPRLPIGRTRLFRLREADLVQLIEAAERLEGAGMISKQDAEEFSQSLEQIGEGWFRQLALGIKLGAPEALGLTRREWCDRIGLKIRNRAERQQIGFELAAEGLSNRAIADVIGVDESTVRADKTAGNPAPNCAGQEGKQTTLREIPHPILYTFINVESPAVKALSPMGRLELDGAIDELCWIEAFLECCLEWRKEDTWDELDGWGGLFEISKRFKKVAATFCRLFPGNARFAETLKYVVKSCALAAQETARLARERAP